MFLLDNILLSPLHGIVWVAREVDKVAQEEFANEVETIKADLSGLYLMLEKAQITEELFDAREKMLLDRLDAISNEEVIGEEEEQAVGYEKRAEEDKKGEKKDESEKRRVGVGG